MGEGWKLFAKTVGWMEQHLKTIPFASHTSDNIMHTMGER
jgi:hypothetical protein